MNDKIITDAGIYAVTVKWSSDQKVGRNQTPCIKLLLVSEEHGKIYATVWNTEKARAGDYMKRICEACGVPNIPPKSAADFKGRQCNVVVNINDRGYPEVDAFQPYDLRKEVTAKMDEPEQELPPEPEPEPESMDEYLDRIEPHDDEYDDDEYDDEHDDIPF